jgi:hypothetical protein
VCSLLVLVMCRRPALAAPGPLSRVVPSGRSGSCPTLAMSRAYEVPPAALDLMVGYSSSSSKRQGTAQQQASSKVMSAPVLHAHSWGGSALQPVAPLNKSQAGNPSPGFVC